MRALSIRQPWAALVALGIKDVENRTWRTPYRGRLLVHASLGRSGRTLKDVAQFCDIPVKPELAQLCELAGGIIGEVDIVDCVSESTSRWFDGPLNSKGKRNYGLVLRDAHTLPFRPVPGRLGLFDVPNIATQIATGLSSMGRDERGRTSGKDSEIVNESDLIETVAN